MLSCKVCKWSCVRLKFLDFRLPLLFPSLGEACPHLFVGLEGDTIGLWINFNTPTYSFRILQCVSGNFSNENKGRTSEL
ncbi:hypothetical protein ACS0TY_026680 [Phlomoides rotata]